MASNGNRVEVCSMTQVKVRRYKKCTVCGARHRTGTDLCKLCRSQQIIDTLRALNDHTYEVGREVEKQLGRLPPCPTDAIPGSFEKIAIMEERQRMGYALHHPEDLKLGNRNDAFAMVLGLGEE